MQSCWLTVANGRTAFEYRDIAVPVPKPGEMLVRVRASALNRGELLASIGWHNLQEPKLAGREVAGEVEALGEGVTAFKVGDRIMARVHGAFAEYVCVSPRLAMTVPQSLSWEEAGAVPIAYLTAYVALCKEGRLKAGEWVLVTGASSGVGVACIQIAKVFGARVIGTSTSEAKLCALQTLGMEAGILTRGGDFSDQVRAVAGDDGVQLAINLIGGSVFPGCVAALARQGRLMIVGYVDGLLDSTIDLEAVHAKRLQIMGISNAYLTPDERAAETAAFVRDVLPALSDRRIVPVVDRVFRFDALPAAKDYVEANRHVGKVVVTL
jgi:NADPH:quinone reductase-like Zn-dependent oxidoreductase